MSYNVFTLPPGDCGALGPKRKRLNIANGRIADIFSRNTNWPNKHRLMHFDRIGCESSEELRHEAPVGQLHIARKTLQSVPLTKDFPECALARATI